MGNIAIFIPSIKSGGAEKQAVLLAEVLAGEHNVHFISFYGTSNASHSNMEMLENSTVSIYMLHGSFWTKIKELRRILINNSIDTVFNYLTYCDVIGCIVEKSPGFEISIMESEIHVFLFLNTSLKNIVVIF